MRIEILEEAETDLLDGFGFYERQGSGLGQYFLDSLFSDIDSLRLHAGIHEQVFGFHRMLSKRFPWAVYYEVLEDRVRVYAVLDCRQSPARSMERLSRDRSGD